MEVASHFKSTSGGTDSKSTRAVLSRAMWRACAVTAASSANDSYRRVWLRGDQSLGAISNPSNEKPGATVQPVNVQGPRLSAACQARAGTVTCGTSPAWTPAPRAEDLFLGTIDHF